MLLYHGTDYDNAVKICNEKRAGYKGLWCRRIQPRHWGNKLIYDFSEDDTATVEAATQHQAKRRKSICPL